MSEAPLSGAIIGCGLVGQRRARTMSDAKLVACADIDVEKARSLANSTVNAKAFGDWRQMLEQIACDVVIVATLHDSLAEISAAAVSHGRHVLVEKPGGRRGGEIEPVLLAA